MQSYCAGANERLAFSTIVSVSCVSKKWFDPFAPFVLQIEELV